MVMMGGASTEREVFQTETSGPLKDITIQILKGTKVYFHGIFQPHTAEILLRRVSKRNEMKKVRNKTQSWQD
jgi:hypothetical protein